MSKDFTPPSKEILIEMYINQLLPMWKIAENLNIAVGTVYNFIKKYEIPTRNQKDTFTFKGHKLTLEERKRISKMNKGRIFTDEWKKNLSEAKKIQGFGHKKHRSDGYISVYYPTHPCASKDGYVMEHRLVMEEYLGRYLTKNEVVHHIDFNRSNNNINNLKLMKFKDHMKLHMELRKERNNQYGT